MHKLRSANHMPEVFRSFAAMYVCVGEADPETKPKRDEDRRNWFAAIDALDGAQAFEALNIARALVEAISRQMSKIAETEVRK